MLFRDVYIYIYAFIEIQDLMGEIHVTLWTALRPSKHLCRTGVNGVVARVAGKGRGEGRAAQQITRHHQTQDLAM